MAQPPGSRVRSTLKPNWRRRFSRSSVWVVLPLPSGPSTVRKNPRGISPPGQSTARRPSVSGTTTDAPATVSSSSVPQP